MIAGRIRIVKRSWQKFEAAPCPCLSDCLCVFFLPFPRFYLSFPPPYPARFSRTAAREGWGRGREAGRRQGKEEEGMSHLSESSLSLLPDSLVCTERRLKTPVDCMEHSHPLLALHQVHPSSPQPQPRPPRLPPELQGDQPTREARHKREDASQHGETRAASRHLAPASEVDLHLISFSRGIFAPRNV